MIRRIGGLALAGGLLGLTAACGGTSSAADIPRDDSVPGTPVVQVTVDVTGDVTIKGTTTALPGTMAGIDYDSCAKYLAGEDHDNGEKYFVLPKELGNRIDNQMIFVGVQVKGYTGPGDYDGGKLTDVGGGPGIVIGAKTYTMENDEDGTVTVDGNGGGQWEFRNLSFQNPDSTTVTDALSGTVTWTCKNP
jgi:hypothetical protein